MSDRITQRLDRLRTQYRESPNLIETIRTALLQVEDASDVIAAIPAALQVDTATGDQLTILGKRLGWPRKHCICTTTPVFGFDEAYAGPFEIAGFGQENSTWSAYEDGGIADYDITDDGVYRKFLKARIFQTIGAFDYDNLQFAIRSIWPEGWIPSFDPRGVTIAPGIPFGEPSEITEDTQLTIDTTLQLENGDPNLALLQLWPRVLPVSIGVPVYYHFGISRQIFGFGEGWSGLSAGREVSRLTTQSGDNIQTESGDYLSTDTPPLLGQGTWLYPVNVSPC